MQCRMNVIIRVFLQFDIITGKILYTRGHNRQMSSGQRPVATCSRYKRIRFRQKTYQRNGQSESDQTEVKNKIRQAKTEANDNEQIMNKSREKQASLYPILPL